MTMDSLSLLLAADGECIVGVACIPFHSAEISMNTSEERICKLLDIKRELTVGSVRNAFLNALKIIHCLLYICQACMKTLGRIILLLLKSCAALLGEVQLYHCRILKCFRIRISLLLLILLLGVQFYKLVNFF